MKVYGVDIFEGDKSVVLANTFDEVREILDKYGIEVASNDEDYWNGKAQVEDLGEVKRGMMYTNATW